MILGKQTNKRRSLFLCKVLRELVKLCYSAICFTVFQQK